MSIIVLCTSRTLFQAHAIQDIPFRYRRRIFSIAVKHTHLVDLVYGWSETQIFPRTVAHISLKTRRQVLRYLSPLRQNLMLGILYGAVFLNVGINQFVQVSSVSPELFRIAVCLAARKYCRDHKRRMSEKRVLHVRLVCYFVFWPVEDLPYKLLV